MMRESLSFVGTAFGRLVRRRSRCAADGPDEVIGAIGADEHACAVVKLNLYALMPPRCVGPALKSITQPPPAIFKERAIGARLAFRDAMGLEMPEREVERKIPDAQLPLGYLDGEPHHQEGERQSHAEESQRNDHGAIGGGVGAEWPSDDKLPVRRVPRQKGDRPHDEPQPELTPMQHLSVKDFVIHLPTFVLFVMGAEGNMLAHEQCLSSLASRGRRRADAR